MNLLLITATPFESNILLQNLRAKRRVSPECWQGKIGKHSAYLLTTGIGALNTVFHLSCFLQRAKFDLILNAGICGSYDRKIPLCSVVEIVSETFCDLGAEDKNTWLPLRKLGFPLLRAKNGKLYYERLKNPYRSSTYVNKIPAPRPAASVTSDTVHGSRASIARVKKYFSPQAENMEGGGVFFTGLREMVPFLEFRVVSNYVGVRNKKTWKLRESSRTIQEFILNWIRLLPRRK